MMSAEQDDDVVPFLANDNDESSNTASNSQDNSNTCTCNGNCTNPCVYCNNENNFHGYSQKLADFDFKVPPEAPVFRPTKEEFKDPLAYINKIRPIAENTGICKIVPPANWQPPFAVDVDKLRFTPRIQRLNELEAKTRIKLNFLDQIAKFWELQGSTLRIPMVERRALDLYTLHTLVIKEGGCDSVTKERKWSKIASHMGYPAGKGVGSSLKYHYEKLLYPYNVFTQQKSKDSGNIKNDAVVKSPKKEVGHSKETETNVDMTKNSKTKYKFVMDIKPKKVDPESTETKEIRKLTLDDTQPNVKIKTEKPDPDPFSKYVCHNCERGDMEETMLLCEACDDSYHTFCLIPPLTDVPKGEWRCPKCIAVEVSRPTEAFGFEQAQREYSLQQFGEMADQFKFNYFNTPVHMVPTRIVEKEFWRIVSSIDEDVTVEYGADLHTMDHGSGFPTVASLHLHPEDLEYTNSCWNLNNLPILEGSVLGYINADISGMKIPWMYVGMCFATFCWHNEDHWSYSINYLHWGEPKTWYGVPGNQAVAFEQTMKSAAPELFLSQPDLLHQLVTIMNPNILMNAGVPVCRTDQNAGEFVVTFPRAYHAGFNQGYNFAEAVNFAPADWLKVGRECILHYSYLRRFCVFSHDELVCKMAVEPDKLDPLIAAATYKDMLVMVDCEKTQRKKLLEWGVTKAERKAFELLPDDERQCEVCKTTCFLSAITCGCMTDALVCLRHYNELCKCPPNKHTLRYRYTLDELPKMLHKLKLKAESFDVWLNKVKQSLDPNIPSTISFKELKGLLAEAKVKKFPNCNLLTALADALDDAEKCASVIRQLDAAIARTRNSGEKKSHLSYEELTLFIEEVDNLSCTLVETKIVKDLLKESCKFEENSKKLLDIPLKDSIIGDVKKCLDYGETIGIELPSLSLLNERLKQLKWIDEVSVSKNTCTSIETIKLFIKTGKDLKPDSCIDNELLELNKLLTKAEEWEECVKNLIRASPASSLQVYEKLLKEAEGIKVDLPTKDYLVNSFKMIKPWQKCLDNVNAGEFYPYIHIVENLIEKAKPITLPIKELEELKETVVVANEWKEKATEIFLQRNSTMSLMEALTPRTPFNVSVLLKIKKNNFYDEAQYKRDNEISPVDLIKTYNVAGNLELDHLRLIRNVNMSKKSSVDLNYKVCSCQQKPYGVMMRCELCRDWYHSSCVKLPKIAQYRVKENFTKIALQMDFKDCKFLCPQCCRTKRPPIEDIINLLESLQKFCIRIPEGEILHSLTERVLCWQDKVKQLLQMDEFQAAKKKLLILSQKISEITARNMAAIPLNKSSVSADMEVDITTNETPNYINNSSDEQILPHTVNEHGYSLHLPNHEDYKCFIDISRESREKLEELLMEGDILEIALDETLELWKLLQVSRDPQLDAILVEYDMVDRLPKLRKVEF